MKRQQDAGNGLSSSNDGPELKKVATEVPPSSAPALPEKISSEPIAIDQVVSKHNICTNIHSVPSPSHIRSLQPLNSQNAGNY
jgi:hypothetical protein